MDAPLLKRILNTSNTAEFFIRHWEKEALVASGEVNRFSPLSSLPALGSIEDLLRHYRSPVMVLGALAERETEGLSDRVAVLPHRAAELYREGATLEFDCMEMYIPEIRVMVEELTRDLDLPAGTFGKAVGYLSAPGSGVSPHFDAYINFVLQLRGRKTWALLPNQTVERPLEHYALNELPFVPEELSAYWGANPPTDYFNLAKNVELTPGDLLFVPRGVWHATSAIEESFSVHFTFSVPTWLEVALGSLRMKLVAMRELRALAFSAHGERKAAIEALEAALQSVRGEELLSSRDEQYDKYQVAGAVFRQVLKLDEPKDSFQIK